MLHQIIIPSASDHTVVVPEAYYGKRVVVTVSAMDEKAKNSKNLRMKAEEARAFFNSMQVDMTNFKFSREEANER